MIRYGVQRARPNQGQSASGLRGPEPKCKSFYLSIYLSMLEAIAQHYVHSHATHVVIHNHEFSWHLFLCVRTLVKLQWTPGNKDL